MKIPLMAEDVEATPTRISKEVEATETMIERTKTTLQFEARPSCR